MELLKGMKGPTRPAPSVPGVAPNVTRYSPVTNWNDDPFGADVFEPTPQYMQKKKPPPRPPPPRVNTKPPDVPLKPSHFMRKPTVLSSLLSRKNKATVNQTQTANIISLTANQSHISEFSNDTNKMFPKCEPKNIQTGALIDLSSPPSSPTFTTRSSSDGLSVDSFGSDATTSTNHHNVMNGNASQAESGFEDDFDLFLHSRKVISKDDTLEDFTTIDPFSPQIQTKPPVMKKPVLSKDLFEMSSNNQTSVLPKGPTIIRAKPARPKPPDNSALLKNTFGGSFPTSTMNLNTTTPIQKVCNGSGENFDWKSTNWEDEGSPVSESPEREWSPPMPSVPPPPPPPEAEEEELAVDWSASSSEPAADWPQQLPPEDDPEQPWALALFDYFTDHPDDLCFSAGSKIMLLRRVDDEWMYGRLRSGVEGLFPANYVEVKVPLVPLGGEPAAAGAGAGARPLGAATALYDLDAATAQPGDLCFLAGDTITVLHRINDDWYFGTCNGRKGQFPVNYVQMS